MYLHSLGMTSVSVSVTKRAPFLIYAQHRRLSDCLVAVMETAKQHYDI